MSILLRLLSIVTILSWNMAVSAFVPKDIAFRRRQSNPSSECVITAAITRNRHPKQFHPSSSSSATTPTTSQRMELNAVIRGEAFDEPEFDEGQGGVRLATESAIKIVGDVRHTKKSDGDFRDVAVAKELKRYTKVTEVPDSDVRTFMDGYGVTLVCTGMGKEVYKDPGESTVKDITLAPSDAVRDALSSIPNQAVRTAKKMVLNFLGGDDLIMGEVLDALAELVDGLDLADQTLVTFNSLCHTSFPLEIAAVTAVAIGDVPPSEKKRELTGVEKSVSKGEIYFSRGKWWTVVEEDINGELE